MTTSSESPLPTVTGFLRMSPAQRMDWVEDVADGSAHWRGSPLEDLLVAILTQDQHPVIRHEAGFVLGKMHTARRIEGKRALAALCSSALDDPSMVVRHECAEALAAFDGALVEEVLQRLMRDSDPDVAATAALSWERLGRRIGDGHSSPSPRPHHRYAGC